jgi:transcriptional regulator with XRE-family HTH domain
MSDLQTRVHEALQDRVISVVSQRTGVHHNTIARIRTGEKHAKGPRLTTLKVLAQYLKVEV